MPHSEYSKIFFSGTLIAFLLVAAIIYFGKQKKLNTEITPTVFVAGPEVEVGTNPKREAPEGSAVTLGMANTELTQTYLDKTYRFSFRYPAGFAVRNVKTEDGYSVSVEKGKDGFQVFVTPYDDTGAITEARIKKDIPGMKIENTQPVLIGASGQGLAFMSDNADWNGASREVWFVFKKHLYQISTYAELDELLKQILQTWKFE